MLNKSNMVITLENLNEWLQKSEINIKDIKFLNALSQTELTEEMIKAICSINVSKRIAENIKGGAELPYLVLAIEKFFNRVIQAACNYEDEFMSQLSGDNEKFEELQKSAKGFNPKNLYLLRARILDSVGRVVPALVFYHSAQRRGTECGEDIKRVSDIIGFFSKSGWANIEKRIKEEYKKHLESGKESFDFLETYVNSICNRIECLFIDRKGNLDSKAIINPLKDSIYNYLSLVAMDGCKIENYSMYCQQISVAVEQACDKMLITPYMYYLKEHKNDNELKAEWEQMKKAIGVKSINVSVYGYSLGKFDVIAKRESFLNWLNIDKLEEEKIPAEQVGDFQLRLSYIRDYFRNCASHGGETMDRWMWEYLLYEVIFSKDSLFKRIHNLLARNKMLILGNDNEKVTPISRKVKKVVNFGSLDMEMVKWLTSTYGKLEKVEPVDNGYSILDKSGKPSKIKKNKNLTVKADRSEPKDKHDSYFMPTKIKVKGSLNKLQPVWFESFYKKIKLYSNQYGFAGIENVADGEIGTIVKSIRRQKLKIKASFIETRIDKMFNLTESMIGLLDDIGFPWQPLTVGADE